MTPLQVEFRLECRWNPNPSRHIDSRAGRDAARGFKNDGVIVDRPNSDRIRPTFDLTEKGEAWVNAILSTPCPVQRTTTRWVDPRSEQEVPDTGLKIRAVDQSGRVSTGSDIVVTIVNQTGSALDVQQLEDSINNHINLSIRRPPEAE